MKNDKISKPVVAANWKMHPQKVAEAKKLFAGIKRTAPHLEHPTTVICPPDLYLGLLADSYGGSKIFLGSQDVSAKKNVGSYTGEVSAEQVASTDSAVSIIGHSERRAMGESNELITQKTKRALSAGLQVILCIGEKKRDEDGDYLDFLRQQMMSVYAEIPQRLYDQIIIAYEPLWAIGGESDNAVTPHVLHQTAGFIRKVLRQNVVEALGSRATILYGGSVKRDNARKLFVDTKIDGFLIGGASLDADHFCDILRVVNDAYDDGN